MIQTIAHVLHRHFIFVILASYLLAALQPGVGIWIRSADLARVTVLQTEIKLSLPPLLLAILLFNAGLGIQWTELNQLVNKPTIVLSGTLGNIATPLAFIYLVSYGMQTWHNPDEIQNILVGLALVASMPIAGASTAWAQNANGNLALSIGLILLTTFLSPVVTPFVLHAVGYWTTGDYSEDLHEIAADGVMTFLGVWVIAPSLLGIITRRLIGGQRIAELNLHIKLANLCILLLLNYSNASLSLPEALAKPDIDFLGLILFVVVALCLAGFATGYLISRMLHTQRSDRASLMFGLGMNNNGTGLVLVSMALADHAQVMLPIIFYNLVQHLVASLVDLALFQRQRRLA